MAVGGTPLKHVCLERMPVVDRMRGRAYEREIPRSLLYACRSDSESLIRTEMHELIRQHAVDGQ